MKGRELKEMPDEELAVRLAELRKELLKSKAQVAVGTALKSPGQMRQAKRTIARILNARRGKGKE